jgi:hypothetical protein
MSDASPTPTRHPTRAYLSENATQIILRTDGNDTVIPLLDHGGEPRVPEMTQRLLAREMTAILLVRGLTIEQIAKGEGVPDRSLPVGRAKTTEPRKLNRVKQAIANVRAAEFIKLAKKAGDKLGATDAQKKAEAEVREFTDAEIEALSAVHAVRLEITKLAGGQQMTLEEAIQSARARVGDGSLRDAGEEAIVSPGAEVLAEAAD